MVFMVFSFSMSLCLPLRLSPSVRADPETSALSPLLGIRITLDRWVAVGLVLNHRCRHCRPLGTTEDHRHPRGHDWQPDPLRHLRLLPMTPILRSSASASRSPSARFPLP